MARGHWRNWHRVNCEKCVRSTYLKNSKGWVILDQVDIRTWSNTKDIRGICPVCKANKPEILGEAGGEK